MKRARSSLMVHRVKIQVDKGLWHYVQPLESSNYKFEPSKNNVLSSLRTMDENTRWHEQVLKLYFIFWESTTFILILHIQIWWLFILQNHWILMQKFSIRSTYQIVKIYRDSSKLKTLKKRINNFKANLSLLQWKNSSKISSFLSVQ